MNASQNYYPANPVNVPAAATQPSPAFKTQVKKVMSSITLFFIVYILLVIISVALGAGCVVIGVAVIAGLASLIGLMLGLGIISIGIMVFIFLIKFIFSVKKFDESGTVRVTEEEQPILFSFIRQLTVDTQTQFPRKIIISPDVNASVFYNDSFWSMFFPVKKNLQIGLGLVNTLTLSEFKAVMAHEFGHFSQRSMKLGTFVYNVNKAIYNMLYENKDYGGFLERFGSVHWGIGIFVWFTIQLIKGIQAILQSMYSFINKNYMGLSRQMEFHADAVAASVSGSDNLIIALRKAEISDFCYNAVLQKADEQLEAKAVFANVYAKHQIVMEHYANENNLHTHNHVPVPDESFFNKFQRSRVNITNQWASHPAREDREKHLLQLDISAERDDQSAWVLFDNPVQLQQQLTKVVYRNVSDDRKQLTIDEAQFKEKYKKDIDAGKFPAKYNGYFDNRVISDMEIDTVVANQYPPEITPVEFDRLFSNEYTLLPELLSANQGDAQVVQKISNKEMDVKTFDFDGDKYQKGSAPAVLETLNREIEQQKARVQQHDEAIVSFFYSAALKKDPGEAAVLREKYFYFFDNRKQMENYFSICQRIINLLLPLLHGQTVTIEKANQMGAGLQGEGETLKSRLKEWLAKGAFDNNIALKEKIKKFGDAQYQYFSGDTFFNTELQDIHQIVNDGLNEISGFQFRNFKGILEYQLTLL